jgi:hypothetical protein
MGFGKSQCFNGVDAIKNLGYLAVSLDFTKPYSVLLEPQLQVIPLEESKMGLTDGLILLDRS